jgi:hypothetical protein
MGVVDAVMMVTASLRLGWLPTSGGANIEGTAMLEAAVKN